MLNIIQEVRDKHMCCYACAKNHGITKQKNYKGRHCIILYVDVLDHLVMFHC